MLGQATVGWAWPACLGEPAGKPGRTPPPASPGVFYYFFLPNVNFNRGSNSKKSHPGVSPAELSLEAREVAWTIRPGHRPWSISQGGPVFFLLVLFLLFSFLFFLMFRLQASICLRMFFFSSPCWLQRESITSGHIDTCPGSKKANGGRDVAFEKYSLRPQNDQGQLFPCGERHRSVFFLRVTPCRGASDQPGYEPQVAFHHGFSLWHPRKNQAENGTLKNQIPLIEQRPNTRIGRCGRWLGSYMCSTCLRGFGSTRFDGGFLDTPGQLRGLCGLDMCVVDGCF